MPGCVQARQFLTHRVLLGIGLGNVVLVRAENRGGGKPFPERHCGEMVSVWEFEVKILYESQHCMTV